MLLSGFAVLLSIIFSISKGIAQSRSLALPAWAGVGWNGKDAPRVSLAQVNPPSSTDLFQPRLLFLSLYGLLSTDLTAPRWELGVW